MALNAAQVAVDVLDRGLGALRPARTDEYLAALGVHGTDHDGESFGLAFPAFPPTYVR